MSGIPASTALDALPSGGNTLLEPAIEPAPDGSNAEWFVVSGQSQDLLSITPTGQQTRVASGLPADSGYPDNYASVDADGYDWVLDNDQGQPENVLYAVGAAEFAQPRAQPGRRLQRLRRGHDPRTRRRALHQRQRRQHHPVQNHHDAHGELR